MSISTEHDDPLVPLGNRKTMNHRLIVGGWRAPSPGWVTFPSWLLSAVVHLFLVVVIVLLAQLPSCRSDMAGDEGTTFRQVGIHLRPARAEASEQNDSDADLNDVLALRSHQPASPKNEPPVPLSLPKLSALPPLVGAGHAATFADTALSELITPLSTPATGSAPSTTGAPVGGTSFLGIQDVGKRFAYVIDRSSSMEDDHALAFAKTELQASLQRLDETQEFQIIFYNDRYDVLQPRGGRFDFFRGSDPQRLQVSEQLQGIQPTGGTRHLPPILQALRFRPDVIFVLSDGDAQTGLSKRDREEIRVANRGRARIHCIGFGRSAPQRTTQIGDYLKQLADENGGKYVYRDLSQP